MHDRLRVRVVPWLLALLLPVAALHAADKSPEEWFDEGLGYVGENKLPEAEAALTEAVKADPRYKEAWQALAEVLEMAGKTARAKLCRQQADQAPAVRDGDPPALNPAQRIALIDRGGAAPPAPAQPATPAQPTTPARPAAPQPTATAGLQPLPTLTTKGADGKPKPFAVLSKEGRAQFCDLTCTPDGTLHAIYTDRPSTSNFPYLYHRSSRDGGVTWSEPSNLSDDESGRMAAYCTLGHDAAGRVYAFWKYLDPNEILYGPGGYDGGVLVMRCWQAGTWLPRLALNQPTEPIFAWYTSPDAAGRLHLVYSQCPADATKALGIASGNYANRVASRVLDGANIGPINLVIEPEAVLTQQQVQAARAAGRPVDYDKTRPRSDGLINLRGLIGGDGKPLFIAEHPGGVDQYGNINTGRRIVLWDGTMLRPLYEYEKYQTYATWQNPPALLLDAAGQRHMLRSPEKAALPAVRDYPLFGFTPAEPASILACQQGSGRITSFQPRSLPGGRMVVTIGKTESGTDYYNDHNLYISFSDGGGQWTPPLCVTDNELRAELAAGNTVETARAGHHPRYAAVAIDGTGHPCVLMTANEAQSWRPCNVVFLRL